MGRFTPVAPEYVKEQLDELVEWLRDPETMELSPVERAAIAHYKLVRSDIVKSLVNKNSLAKKSCWCIAEIECVARFCYSQKAFQVVVHPFVDGNGRTARLLLNLILMRAGYPPVILPVESRAEYYATLHTANLGDLRPFVRYIAKHTENTLKVREQTVLRGLYTSEREGLVP